MRLHKLRAHFPKINKESAQWKAFADSIKANGITQNLVITVEGAVVTNYSAWAWEAAKDWAMASVPCTVVDDDYAAIIWAETGLCQTEQMTRGAQLYLIIPRLGEVIQGAEMRRLANLKKGVKTNEIELKPQQFSVSSNLTPETSIKALCSAWGIGRDTFYMARNVWIWLNEPSCKALAKLHEELEIEVPQMLGLKQLQEDLRNDFEPGLLGMAKDEGKTKNLWNVESGIKGRLKGGEHELPNKQLELFGDALDSLAVRAGRFSQPKDAAGEVEKWIKNLKKNIQDPDQLHAKLQLVAETCEVTKQAIKDWIKENKPISATDKH